MQDLIQFCTTDRQREVIKALIDHKSHRAAAKHLGVHHRQVSKTLAITRKRAALQGHSPEHGMTKVVPDGFKVNGVSSYYDKDGKLTGQWVKSSADEERRYQMMLEAIEALKEELPKVGPTDYNGDASDDLLAAYPIGDAHHGLRVWHEECGQDWDLVRAESVFLSVFDRLVKTAPRCKQAAIINLGDWYHTDNISATTERSGNRLSVDGRYAKMARIGMKIMRRMIESALEHHETVRVINAIGNHDDTGSMFLSIALAHIYENEPRVIVDTSPAPFHYIQHGKCLVGVHHGHSCKPDRLPLVMATDMAKEWGESEHRQWWIGHIHHDTLKEYPGCKVESFRTLAAKDDYATWGGYRSGQDSKCIVLHKDYGEVERHTVNIGMAC